MINDNFIVLDRIGYGSNFNKISIDINNNIIKKECINEYGQKKINYEINFYKFLINNNISFKTPKIYLFQENGYIMEYLNNYEPLYKVFNLIDNTRKTKLLNKIRENLNNLHNSSKKYILKDEYYLNLKIEIEEKTQNRFNTIKNIIKKYDFIKKVNNIEIIPFEQLLLMINKKIYEFIELSNLSDFYFVPLHGDCQFNNILYNIEKDDFIFIDPRGYYGKSEIYGIPEYDFAKVLFALSGYDEFDNRTINKLDIENDNINININYLDKNILNINNLEILLMYNIWLGNAECFIKNNEMKGIYSYFISLFLGTIFINNNISI